VYLLPCGRGKGAENVVVKVLVVAGGCAWVEGDLFRGGEESGV